jgi:hypothetical protein
MKTQRALAAFQVSLSALFSSAAIMVTPGYRAWVLASTANLALACYLVKQPMQRKVLCGSFIAAVGVSAAVNAFRKPSGELYDLGALILVLLFVALTAVAWSVYQAESDAA